MFLIVSGRCNVNASWGSLLYVLIIEWIFEVLVEGVELVTRRIHE